MFGRSEGFLENEKFGKAIHQKLLDLKVSGKVLSQGNSNTELLTGLVANPAITRLEVLGAKASINAQGLGQTTDGRVFIQPQRSENKFDFVLQFALFEKSARSVDDIKTDLAEHGKFVSVIAMYEEMSLKKKLIGLLLNKFSVEVEILEFEGVELPFIFLVAEKDVHAAPAKYLLMRQGATVENLDYGSVLARIKEKYLKALPKEAGIKELVPGRRLYYDATNPEVDETIPIYNIVIVDTNNKTLLAKVDIRLDSRGHMLVTSYPAAEKEVSCTPQQQGTTNWWNK